MDEVAHKNYFTKLLEQCDVIYNKRPEFLENVVKEL